MSLALPLATRSASTATSATRVSGLLLALIAVWLFAQSAFSPGVLGDGDTWSHLATGEWMLAHGAVPRADPFSHSMPGAPWTAHEWLSEIVLSGGLPRRRVERRHASDRRRRGGCGADHGPQGRARPVRRGARGRGRAGRRALAAEPARAPASCWRCPSPRHGPSDSWKRAIGTRRRRSCSRPLMTLWSNMHGGFVFGLALIGPFAFEAVAAAPREARIAVLRAWALFGLAAIGAALVNPYGVEALIFPFRLMSMENLSSISEWRPQDFGHVGPMEIALILLLGFALTRPMATPPIRAALVAGLVAMALEHARHAQLLGLVAPMLLASPIAEAIGAARQREWRQGVARVALAGSLAAAMALGALRFAEPIVRGDGRVAPISALAAVPAGLRTMPVLNGYGFGGYLIWSGVRPFIDGRADMYGDAMLGLYRKLDAGDPATVEDTLSRYRIAWTIFPPNSQIVATLDREPGWRRLYADKVAVVHVREAGRDTGSFGN